MEGFTEHYWAPGSYSYHRDTLRWGQISSGSTCWVTQAYVNPNCHRLKQCVSHPYDFCAVEPKIPDTARVFKTNLRYQSQEAFNHRLSRYGEVTIVTISMFNSRKGQNSGPEAHPHSAGTQQPWRYEQMELLSTPITCIQGVDRTKFPFLPSTLKLQNKEVHNNDRKCYNLCAKLKARTFEHNLVHYKACFFYK
jgi:hypothetical protein